VTIAGELPGAAAQLAAGADAIAGKRLDDHSSFPVLDAEAIAINRGDLQVLARVIARFVLLNPTLTADQADMLAHSRSTDVEFDARMRREILIAAALQSLNWLSDKPGRHSLIMVSGGYARDPLDSQQAALVTRSLQVNAPIHFLDARGLSGFGMFHGAQYGAALGRNADEGPYARDEAVEGSSYLADDTGGTIVHNTNDLAKGLAGMFDAMQTYYILSYEAVSHAKPGFHKIQVQLKTKGLNVRARRGYYDVTPRSR
jgi:VWFA-related protein